MSGDIKTRPRTRPAEPAGRRGRAVAAESPRASGPADRGGAQSAPRARAGAGPGVREGMPARLRDRGRLPEKMGRRVRIRLFLASSVPDFLLVLAVSTALSLTVTFGFNSAWAYRGDALLVAGITAPLLLAMFAGSWSKKALAPSAVATVALFVAYAAAAVALSPDPALFADGAINDSQDNYVLFSVVVSAVAVVVYLLSRRTVGLAFLLVIAMLACGVVQFLWRDWVTGQPGVLVTLAVLGGVGMMFVYQCYRQSVYSAKRLKRTSFFAAFGFAAAVAAVCLLAGVGVFYGIVSAAGLSTPDVKVFFERVSPPVAELSEDYEKMHDEGGETTDETDDRESLTGEQGEGDEGDNSRSDLAGGPLSGTAIGQLAQRLAGYDPGDDGQDFEEVSARIQEWTVVITAALVLTALLAAVLAQIGRRSLRLRLISGRSGAYQVWYLYTFLLGRLKRLKAAKPDQLTPLEFAVGSARAMAPFTRGTGGIDFIDVSGVYQDAVYGGSQPSRQELAAVKRYYRAFFRNARRHVGLVKWVLWKFWRI